MKRAALALAISAAMVITGGNVSGQGNSGAKSQSPKATKAAKAPKTKTTDPHAVPTTGTLSPVQQKLQTNTNMANRLNSRLPAGMDPVTEAAGFRNLGQFVAAVNVSNNLGIPFTQLRTSMVADGKSLGQAIQTHRPSADYNAEARRAESDATAFIQQYDEIRRPHRRRSRRSRAGWRAGAERSARQYPQRTRWRSSSKKFTMTLIWVGVASAVTSGASRKRLPSGAMAI